MSFRDSEEAESRRLGCAGSAAKQTGYSLQPQYKIQPNSWGSSSPLLLHGRPQGPSQQPQFLLMGDITGWHRETGWGE